MSAARQNLSKLLFDVNFVGSGMPKKSCYFLAEISMGKTARILLYHLIHMQLLLRWSDIYFNRQSNYVQYARIHIWSSGTAGNGFEKNGFL